MWNKKNWEKPFKIYLSFMMCGGIFFFLSFPSSRRSTLAPRPQCPPPSRRRSRKKMQRRANRPCWTTSSRAGIGTRRIWRTHPLSRKASTRALKLATAEREPASYSTWAPDLACILFFDLCFKSSTSCVCILLPWPLADIMTHWPLASSTSTASICFTLSSSFPDM